MTWLCEKLDRPFRPKPPENSRKTRRISLMDSRRSRRRRRRRKRVPGRSRKSVVVSRGFPFSLLSVLSQQTVNSPWTLRARAHDEAHWPGTAVAPPSVQHIGRWGTCGFSATVDCGAWVLAARSRTSTVIEATCVFQDKVWGKRSR